MLNYYFTKTNPKQEVPVPKNGQNPAEIIEKAEDLASKWVTEGLQPDPEDQQKPSSQPQKPPQKKIKQAAEEEK